MKQIKKLYTITRSDLTEGYQVVQSTHAAINFTFEHPSRAGPWFNNSNYLVQLVLENEKQLKFLIEKFDKLDIYHTVFREPDIGNKITAISAVLEPDQQKLVSKIPLLFKDKINKNVNTIKNSGYESQISK